MTSIVGILCRDGVVIGADSSVTFVQEGHIQIPMIEQKFEKIEIIGEHVIVVGTGSVGQGQRFCEIVKKAWNDKVFQNEQHTVGKKLCAEAVKDFAETAAQHGNYGALVGFPCLGKACLTEFPLSDFQPEMKTEQLWFASMGSAQHITDTFLAFLKEVFWSSSVPNVNDGIFAAKWTLDNAVSWNPGGVNGPVRIAVLEMVSDKYQARILHDDELQEHSQAIIDAKTALAHFRNEYRPTNHPEIPPVPEPETLDNHDKAEGELIPLDAKPYQSANRNRHKSKKI